jgi:hypothetical protein
MAFPAFEPSSAVIHILSNSELSTQNSKLNRPTRPILLEDLISICKFINLFFLSHLLIVLHVCYFVAAESPNR